jgi:hypothetical protein
MLEASQVNILFGIVAPCYSVIVLSLGEAPTILSRMMQSAVYRRDFEIF